MKQIIKNGKAWLVAVLCAVLCLPLLWEYFAILQGKDYYKFWPACVILSGVLFLRRWKQAPPATSQPPRWVVTVLFLAAIAIILVSLLYYTQWGMAFAWVVLMGAGACYLSRYRDIKNIFGLWLLLFLVLRPPYQLLLRMLAWMENWTIKSASLMLDYQSMIHVVQGNLISLPKHDFGIDVICSSWVSMISTVATAAFIAVFRDRRVFHCLLLLGLALVSTWILNNIRIVAVISFNILYDIDLLSGGYMIGYQLVSFLIVLLLLLSSDALVSFCFSNLGGPKVTTKRSGRKKRRLAAFLSKLYDFQISTIFPRSSSEQSKALKPVPSILLVVVLVMLVGLEAVVLYNRPTVTRRELMYGEGDVARLNGDSVIFQRSGWSVVDYSEETRAMSSDWGSFSNIWRLKYSGITVVMALDYPFDDWHDVKRCYSNIGWRIKDERTIDDLPTYQWNAAQTDMILPNGDIGYILCSHNDHFGRPIQPKPAKHDLSMLLYRIHPDKMTPPFGDWSNKAKRTHYQTQCMVATPDPLDELTKKEVLMMYADFREQVRQIIERKSKTNKKN